MSNVNTFKMKEPKKIPKWIKEKLEVIIQIYGKERWFPRAWAAYIKLCKTTPVHELPDPEIFFSKEELKEGIEVSISGDGNKKLSPDILNEEKYEGNKNEKTINSNLE